LALLATTVLCDLEPAAAQGAVPCTAIANDAERLACYDRALRPAPAPAAPAAAETAAQPPVTPRNAPVAGPSATPVAPAPEARRARTVRESAAPAAPAAPVAGAPAELAIVPIVVIDVHALPGRGATFTTAGGEVWVQTDSGRNQLPDTPFAAEIKPGAMSSYFLVPKDRARAVRVRRAQ
jgi:hypothetical protein